MLISASVGRGGVNRPDDVRMVQILLNDSRGKSNLPLIKVDGLIGPITIAAITLFQQRNTGIVDGRVDPKGPALSKLVDSFIAERLQQAEETDGVFRLVEDRRREIANTSPQNAQALALFTARTFLTRSVQTDLTNRLKRLQGEGVPSSSDFTQIADLTTTLEPLLGQLKTAIEALPLAQGQADGRSREEASEAARSECIKSLTGRCSPGATIESLRKDCSCFVGGVFRDGFTCICMCRCKEPPPPPPPPPLPPDVVS